MKQTSIRSVIVIAITLAGMIAYAEEGQSHSKQAAFKAADIATTSSTKPQDRQAGSVADSNQFKATESAAMPPNYGPFEAVTGNSYAIKGDSTLLTIIRTDDGSMALKVEYFYNNTKREFEIPQVSTDGIPKQEKCILSFASNCTVILLPDGTLRREQIMAYPQTNYRFIHEYRVAESSIVSTTEYVRISGEENSVLEEKKTRTLERITPSDTQAVKGKGREFAQKVAQDKAEAEADYVRNKAIAAENRRQEQMDADEQRQNLARTWANVGNAIQQDANRMRSMERQLQSGARQAITAAEQSHKPGYRASQAPVKNGTPSSPGSANTMNTQISSSRPVESRVSGKPASASTSSSAYLTIDDSYAKENRKHAEMMEAWRKKAEREEAERERIRVAKQAEIDAESARRATDSKKAKADLKTLMEQRKKTCDATGKDCGSLASRQ